MSTPVNRQYKLAQRPVGMVKREDFEFAQGPVAELQDGQLLAVSYTHLTLPTNREV